jgi:CheY-like chemotaxis protein
VLLNLYINARDAMPEGGSLAVTAANFQADETCASMVAGARPGAYVQVQVSDTGCGIPAEHLPKIFDPFFTTKEPGRGTGLGLATVQKVVTEHGGFLTVHSEVGKGTTFDVYFPAQPGAEAHTEHPPTAPAPTGHGELILIVDDEEAVRQATQAMLLRSGYRAVAAGDGVEAVAVFARHREEVKAVVTDLMMPELDGLGLVRVLARMAPGLRVVVSTGLGGDAAQGEKLAALRALGVNTILTKPYTADQMLLALQIAQGRDSQPEPTS